jgi:hypothetical protein
MAQRQTDLDPDQPGQRGAGTHAKAQLVDGIPQGGWKDRSARIRGSDSVFLERPPCFVTGHRFRVDNASPRGYPKGRVRPQSAERARNPGREGAPWRWRKLRLHAGDEERDQNDRIEQHQPEAVRSEVTRSEGNGASKRAAARGRDASGARADVEAVAGARRLLRERILRAKS